MVGRDDDVRAIQEPLARSASSMRPMPPSTSDQRFPRQIGADAVGVCGSIRIVDPHERDIGVQFSSASLM